jgi:esterase/lipase
MKTKIYIIPGLGESTRMVNYREVIKLFKKADFKVIPIKIVWSLDMDITDYINQANKQIPNISKNDYVLGFSFGAYIASILSKKKKVKGFIFCSLSPFFKENIKNIPEETKKYFGQKMINSFKKYSFPSVSKSRA